MQPISARQWSSGFLPSKFQGVKLNSFGDLSRTLTVLTVLTTAAARFYQRCHGA